MKLRYIYRDMGPDPEPPESEFIEPDAGTPDHDDDFQTEYYPVIGTCRALYAFDGRYWLLSFVELAYNLTIKVLLVLDSSFLPYSQV